MKLYKYHFPGINPINRDLILVLITGLMISLVIVTIGFWLL